MSEDSVFGLLLAGGRSRRMGSDKALLDRGDGSQLDHAMRVLGAAVDGAWVSARPDQADEPARARHPQIIDRYEGIGPVAGILSAMDEHPGAAWLVLACDLPNVDGEVLARLLAARDRSRPFTAYRSVHNGLPEPLCAIYEPGARALLDEFVAAGIHCPRKMMIRGEARLVEQPHAGALDNLNTPEDLSRSELRAAS